MSCYDINIEEDNDDIHPPTICNRCLAHMSRIEATHGRVRYTPDPELSPATWCVHSEACVVCNAAPAKGRPKKATKNRGRPPGETTNHLIRHITSVSGPSITANTSSSRISSSQVNPAHIICSTCSSIVDEPVALSCGQLVCRHCIVQSSIEQGPDVECPSCKSPLTSDHVEKCADVVLEVIQNVRVHCSSCKHDFPFKELVCHEEACAGHCSSTTHLPRHTAHEVTLEVVMQTPLDDPLSPDEQVACTHLIKRAMQGGNQLVLKTGSQVRYTHCKNIPVTCKCTNHIHVNTMYMYMYSNFHRVYCCNIPLYLEYSLLRHPNAHS